MGVGGMGGAFAAMDERLDRPVVVKIVPAEDHDARSTLEREARAAGRCRHPGLIHIRSVEEWAGMVVLATEYVEGPSLRERLSRHGPPQPSESIRLVLFLCDALEHAHSRGVVHCDIHPENIRLEPGTGDPVLVDFGIASILDIDGGRRREIVGTAPYMAPEQIRAGLVSPATDVFALATVFWELLTGEPLFKRESEPATHTAILSGEREKLRSLAAPLGDLLLAATSVDPDRRPGDGGAFGAALSDVAEAAGMAPDPSTGGAQPLAASPTSGPVDMSELAGKASVVAREEADEDGPSGTWGNASPAGRKVALGAPVVAFTRRWGLLAAAVVAAVALFGAGVTITAAGVGGLDFRTTSDGGESGGAMRAEPGPGEGTNQGSSMGAVECTAIEDSGKKHECYLEEVEEGLDCWNVESVVERNYCFRALDESGGSGPEAVEAEVGQVLWNEEGPPQEVDDPGMVPESYHLLRFPGDGEPVLVMEERGEDRLSGPDPFRRPLEIWVPDGCYAVFRDARHLSDYLDGEGVPTRLGCEGEPLSPVEEISVSLSDGGSS